MYYLLIITLVSSIIGLIVFFWVHLKNRVSAVYPEPRPEHTWYSIDIVSFLEGGIDRIRKVFFSLFIFLLKQAILLYRFSTENIRKHLRSHVYRILSTDTKQKQDQEESQFLKTVGEYKKQMSARKEG
jgi:hypothetical protein